MIFLTFYDPLFLRIWHYLVNVLNEEFDGFLSMVVHVSFQDFYETLEISM